MYASPCHLRVLALEIDPAPQFRFGTLLLSDTFSLRPGSDSPERLSRLAARLASVHRREAKPTREQVSRFTVSTGAGTDENDGEIRHRAAFLWEEAVVEPRPPVREVLRWLRWAVTVRLPQKAAVFFGVSPIVTDWRPRQGEELLIDLAVDDEQSAADDEGSMQCR